MKMPLFSLLYLHLIKKYLNTKTIDLACSVNHLNHPAMGAELQTVLSYIPVVDEKLDKFEKRPQRLNRRENQYITTIILWLRKSSKMHTFISLENYLLMKNMIRVNLVNANRPFQDQGLVSLAQIM